MTLRTTGLRLVAEIAQFKRNMAEGQKAVRDVRGEVDSTVTASDRMGEQLAKASKKSGTALSEITKVASELDDQIRDTERSIAKLATAYVRGGGNDVMKQIQEQQRTLKELKGSRSLLPSAKELESAGADVGKSVIGGIRTAISGASPQALGVPALGLLMAPTLGAAVAGAVVGGAALGGVIGGVTLAARSPEVKDAGKDLGKFLMADLTQRAVTFQGPVLEAMDRFRAGFQDMDGDLDKIFNSARFVAPLTDGAVRGARGFVSGFAEAIDKADPVVETLAELFAEAGTSAGDFFDSMADDADEGALALQDVTFALTSLIQTVGQLVSATAAVKGFGNEADKMVDKFRYWVEDSYNSNEAIKQLGYNLDITADGFANGSIEAEAYRKATVGTATAADFATLKTAGMSNAQIAAADSSGRFTAELARVERGARMSTAELELMVASENDVQDVQQEATLTQQAYTKSIEMLAPAANQAKMMVQGLKQATDLLYGSQEAAIDAAEGYEAAFDNLTTAVKGNKGSLDMHTEAGRKNRDALQDLLKSSRDLYFADLQAGVSTDKARAAHDRRTDSVRKEAREVGLDKKETDRLIQSYGRIPSNRTTSIVQKGVMEVLDAMMELYVYQRSLAEGIPIASARAALNKANSGPAKRYGGYHEGGHTGPGPKMQPAGVVHADEYVIKKESRQKIEAKSPGLLDEMNATGQLPGYAGGGWVGAFPVEVRNFKAPVTGDKTAVPTKDSVASKVIPQFARNRKWPASPSVIRRDSGRWRYIKKYLDDLNMGGKFGNGYRPGDPKWHGSGWAVDWMGFNQDRLAAKLASLKPLELIHRGKKRDYAYTRGVNKGSFNRSLMEAHRNHIHIAMDRGGVIQEPVMGMGVSGRTYSFGEGYRPERVVPMGASGGAGGGAHNVTINVHVPIGQNPRQTGIEILNAIRPALEGGATLVLANGTKVF